MLNFRRRFPAGLAWNAFSLFLAALAAVSAAAQAARPAKPADAPIPDARQLMQEVHDHQLQLDKARENYTFHRSFTEEELDSKGKVKKTESSEQEVFFVNGHEIGREIKKNGKPLDEQELARQSESLTKKVQEAEKTPPDQSLHGHDPVSISHILSLMNVSNPRREIYRGRAAIVFDFSGRKDAKTHGIAEDASKKLQGTIWIDEQDRQVAHMTVRFVDNFHVDGGLVATIEKGSTFTFDQAPIHGDLWLPTGSEAFVNARVLLLMGYRGHFVEQDTDFERFHAEAQQETGAPVKPPAQP